MEEGREGIKCRGGGGGYLKELYDIYEDWNVVVGGYKCGGGSMKKGMGGGGGEKELWKM